MSSQEYTDIEQALDLRLEQVRRTRAAMRREAEGGLSGELAHLDNHPADDGTETHERSLEMTTEVFLDEEERRIAEARKALAAGTYGKCADCGQQIPPARLAAVPEAVRCLDCQRHFEGLHGQHHRPGPEL